MNSTQEFFRKKKRWSKYKDLILDYYLEPYLAKVAHLGKPILVVDCFAGPGRFEDGQLGSPLLISNRLKQACQRGTDVIGFYVEKDPTLHNRLVENTRDSDVPVYTKQGDFRDYIDEISNLAHDCTIFLYLDPIRPSDLLFGDMESIYEQLQHGNSVEVLINFMSVSFFRAIRGLASHILMDDSVNPAHDCVRRWDAIAGGTYWQSIVFDEQVPDSIRVEKLARGYAQRLKERFAWVITYPIRHKYEHEFPKYHLVFGSRHPDAIELMNRAMVTARREFVGARFVDGFLFPNEPESEIVKPKEIERMVLETSAMIGRGTWKELRLRATIHNPCMYTDSEINRAIKKAIKNRRLGSDATGNKIEERASIWPITTTLNED